MDALLSAEVGDGSTLHIFSPSHNWPHQQRPWTSIKQVPEPQQRVSSMVSSLSVDGVFQNANRKRHRCSAVLTSKPPHRASATGMRKVQAIEFQFDLQKAAVR
jgi:hypothetical protein